MSDFDDVSGKYQRIISDFIENSDHSQRSFAREVGVSSEIVNRIVRGENPNVQLDTLVDLLKPTNHTIRLKHE